MEPEPLSPEPFRLEPIFSPRLWGARSLAPLFPEMKDLEPPIGEAWLTGLECKIANGPFAGETLGQSWKKMTVHWRGPGFEDSVDFPLLVKFIFPTDKLSIQVHPDDAYAAEHEVAAGGRGKTEMWHVVSAEPGARLLAALRPGVTKEQFRAALVDNSLEELFQSHEVRSDDTFFLPAGMPHTIGPNMVICEVQEYSDLTYRVYDYGRVDANGNARELHIEKALEVIQFSSDANARVQNPAASFKKIRWEPLVDCPFFATLRFDFDERALLSLRPPLSPRFCLWVFLQGEGEIEWASPENTSGGDTHIAKFSYKQGECWFIPAETHIYSICPAQKTSVIVAYPNAHRHEE